MGDSYVLQLKTEYDKINKRWLRLHTKVVYGFALASFIIELSMCFILNRIDGFVTASLPIYVVKFLLVPSVLNFILAVGVFWSIRSNRFPINIQKYVVSLCLTGICFVLFSVHNIFPSLALLFIVPILLTTIYGDYSLTSVTAFVSIMAVLVGELVLSWDSKKVPVLENADTGINFLISLLLLTGFYGICLIVIYYERQKTLSSANREIERQLLQEEVLRDNLTSLFNRVALQDSFNTIWQMNSICTLVMIDLDDFKYLNDTYGHPYGDLCLQEFASALKNACFPYPAFRYGGDEFCILFTNEGAEAAVAVCRRIQETLKTPMETSDTPISASFGVAQSTPGMSPQQLLENADVALYRAKATKNSISVFSED